MKFDEDGLLEEPCLSCDKAYVEDIWYEWCCDEKECPYTAEKTLTNIVKKDIYIFRRFSFVRCR